MYETYAKFIDSKSARDQDDFEAYLQGDVPMCHQKAKIHFNDAFRNFEKMHHYMGKYLCKLHELNVTRTSDSDYKCNLEREVKKHQKHYIDY